MAFPEPRREGARQILTSRSDHAFQLDEAALASILLREDLRNKPVVVVSVAGAIRKGKSFLLNFFVRYMRSPPGCGDWFGDPDTPLEGFSWRGGSERDTSGILIWDEVFTVTTSEGKQLAVLFMDTEGAFDCASNVRDSAGISALNTMISSVQVYNLSQNIQENDLQHLQLFTEYGHLASAGTSGKPFQNLVFLVRDWSCPYEAPFGIEGGKVILERRLRISEQHHANLRRVREHIRSCFSELDCFLMPHPGLKVATDPTFDGRLSDIHEDFKDQLKTLVHRLLAPDNLPVKMVNGNEVTCHELLQHVKAYVNIINGDKLPPPTSLLATSDAKNLAAVARAKDKCYSDMKELRDGEQPYLSPPKLGDHHLLPKESARTLFRSTCGMNQQHSQRYENQLAEEIDGAFEDNAKENEKKRSAAAATQPLVLFYFCATCIIFCWCWLGFFFVISTLFVGLYVMHIINNGRREYEHHGQPERGRTACSLIDIIIMTDVPFALVPQ